MRSILGAASISIALAAAGFYLAQSGQSVDADVQEGNPELVAAPARCAEITHPATANTVLIMEFQELELQSRRETVFTSCMTDQSFIGKPMRVSWQQMQPSTRSASMKRWPI